MIRLKLVAVGDFAGILSRLDLDMDLDPHRLLIVLGQAGAERRGALLGQGVGNSTFPRSQCLVDPR